MRQDSVHIEQIDDLLAIERPPEVRIIVNVPGRYSLSSRRNAHGERRLFACRVLNISPSSMLVNAPVVGPVGERVITWIQHFGKLHGVIARPVDCGFLMNIITSEEKREKLNAKLAWFEQFRNYDVADGRAYGRIIPQTPNSTLRLRDGTTLSCLVIDMSASGAALSADITPEVGTVLAVGKVVARVVRCFDEGFAVRFAELQNLDTLEERLIHT